MNSTIFRSQLWELWRFTRLDMALRMFGTLAYLWLFTWMPDGVADYTQGIALSIIVFASLVSSLWLTSYERRSGGGFPFVLGFTRPILTVWLVAVPLVWLMLGNAAIFLALTGVAQKIFAWDLPQLALIPTLLFATTLIALISWCTSHLLERALAAAVLSAGALWLFTKGLVLLDARMTTAENSSVMLSPGPLGYAALLAGITLAAFLCVRGVDRLRSGESLSLPDGKRLLAKSTLANLERLKNFDSPREAQRWFDLRRTGNRALAIVATGLTATLVCSWGAAEFGGESAMAVLWGAAIVITPLALLGGTVDGVMGLKYQGSDSRLSIYEAVRPVTVRQNILQKLAMVVGITLVSWTVFALGAMVIAAAFYGGFLRDLTVFFSRNSGTAVLQTIGIVAGLYVLATALCFTFTLLLMSAGYVAPRLREYPVANGLLFAALTFSFSLPVLQGLFQWNLAGAVHAVQFLWGLFFAVVSIRSLWRAARAGYYTIPWLVAVIVAWAALLVATARVAVYAGVDLPVITPPLAVLIAGLLCVPLASVAWAPLSFAALRHQ